MQALAFGFLFVVFLLPHCQVELLFSKRVSLDRELLLLDASLDAGVQGGGLVLQGFDHLRHLKLLFNLPLERLGMLLGHDALLLHIRQVYLTLNLHL